MSETVKKCQKCGNEFNSEGELCYRCEGEAKLKACVLCDVLFERTWSVDGPPTCYGIICLSCESKVKMKANLDIGGKIIPLTDKLKELQICLRCLQKHSSPGETYCYGCTQALQVKCHSCDNKFIPKGPTDPAAYIWCGGCATGAPEFRNLKPVALEDEQMKQYVSEYGEVNSYLQNAINSGMKVHYVSTSLREFLSMHTLAFGKESYKIHLLLVKTMDIFVEMRDGIFYRVTELVGVETESDDLITNNVFVKAASPDKGYISSPSMKIEGRVYTTG